LRVKRAGEEKHERCAKFWQPCGIIHRVSRISMLDKRHGG
jgi:hypothetical protein